VAKRAALHALAFRHVDLQAGHTASAVFEVARTASCRSAIAIGGAEIASALVHMAWLADLLLTGSLGKGKNVLGGKVALAAIDGLAGTVSVAGFTSASINNYRRAG